MQNLELIRVHPCPNPDRAVVITDPQFVARIDAHCPNMDIARMSGVPILGFRKAGGQDLEYWPVAIQSRRLPKRRVVVGSSFPVIALRIEQWIDRAFEDRSGPDEVRQ
ncbi:MAG: hypothetical protein ACYTFA_06085 [Planctomycetota bacterium]